MRAAPPAAILRVMSLLLPSSAPTIHRFAGTLIGPDDDGYDAARRVHNGMIDRRPALIARCESVADAAAALAYAQDEELEVAVCAGRHSAPGFAMTEGGLVIDVGPMKDIHVDPARRIAWVQPGVLWGELDAATQEHGLAVTGGRASSTGVAGFTLGSGSGWLERKMGLAADNLRAARVLTADGRVVTASADENPDLFWALRGGGGNFGIVVEFEFALRPVGPIILGGMLMWPRERAAEVVRAYRDLMAEAPDALCGGLRADDRAAAGGRPGRAARPACDRRGGALRRRCRARRRAHRVAARARAGARRRAADAVLRAADDARSPGRVAETRAPTTASASSTS